MQCTSHCHLLLFSWLLSCEKPRCIMFVLPKTSLYYFSCSWSINCGPATCCHDSVLSVLLVALELFFSSKKSNNAQINLSKLMLNFQNIQKATFWTVTPYSWLEVTKWFKWQVSFPCFYCYKSLEAGHSIVLYFTILKLTGHCKENVE